MNSAHNRDSVLFGLPLPGQKIIFSKETKWHWFTNVIKDEARLLTLGETYTVRKTELASSATYVWLEEFPDETQDGREQPFFNMHAFKWIPPEIDFTKLIGLDARRCLQLRSTYGVGMYLNGVPYREETERDPIVCIEYDRNEIVTYASFWEAWKFREKGLAALR